MTERTESPDGSRRAAFVGGLYRTARAVPLLCRTGAVHGTPMAMECSDLSELWISLGLRALRTTGCTGRLAPCRFCGSTVPDGSRHAAGVGGGACDYGGDRPNPESRVRPQSPCAERTESPDGSRRAAIVGALHRTARAVPLLYQDGNGRLTPCRFCPFDDAGQVTSRVAGRRRWVARKRPRRP